jgi:hypothetical protein
MKQNEGCLHCQGPTQYGRYCKKDACQKARRRKNNRKYYVKAHKPKGPPKVRQCLKCNDRVLDGYICSRCQEINAGIYEGVW